MRVLILSTAFSGLAQRVQTELKALNYTIEEHYDLDEDYLIDQVARFKPDAIVCPFLTQRIPEQVWRNNLCLIVHPGIEGDRGPSSLDWAISEGAEEWGVTLLQADELYDAGDIWGTRRFPLRVGSKTSIYKREVTQGSIELILQALTDIEHNKFVPRPLDYDSPLVVGRDRPLMKQHNRVIAWEKTSTREALQKLNGADSRPGVRGRINGVEVNMFGAAEESKLRGEPGTILAVHKGAFCCATQDGAVWIKQLKCANHPELAPIKLPATMVLNKICDPAQLELMSVVKDARDIEDIRVERNGDCAYVYFNFYNGAMNTAQCVELKNAIAELKRTDVKIIVLMGGDDFWSNGIHLNCIEASPNPAQESWANINAIDDLVYELIDTPDQITVAALRNNAGAGGVIQALACDEVIIRQGVVLNPHYKTMGLFGSEYWTYLLPKRVGEQKALQITDECLPMLAGEAVQLGLADIIFDEGWADYDHQLKEYCQQLSHVVDVDEFLRSKVATLVKDQSKKTLAEYRAEELAQMKKTFFDPSSSFHQKRRDFVYKTKPVKERVVDEFVARKA